MTKRILNADKPVEEKAIKQIHVVLAEKLPKPLKKKEVKKHWYRVAILCYQDKKLGCYTLVIDRPKLEPDVEKNPNFVRWEPVVEVEV